MRRSDGFMRGYGNRSEQPSPTFATFLSAPPPSAPAVASLQLDFRMAWQWGGRDGGIPGNAGSPRSESQPTRVQDNITAPEWALPKHIGSRDLQ